VAMMVIVVVIVAVVVDTGTQLVYTCVSSCTRHRGHCGCHLVLAIVTLTTVCSVL